MPRRAPPLAFRPARPLRRCWSLYFEQEVEFGGWQAQYSERVAGAEDPAAAAREGAALAQRTLPLLEVRAQHALWRQRAPAPRAGRGRGRAAEKAPGRCMQVLGAEASMRCGTAPHRHIQLMLCRCTPAWLAGPDSTHARTSLALPGPCRQ